MEPIEFIPSYPELTTKEDKASQEKAWSSLVAFLPNFIHLKEVVYACRNQVPAGLLRALHSHPRTPRLHVHGFSLRSLYQSRSNLRNIDDDEYLLISSQCLTSIRARDTTSGYDSRGHVSFNEEAIWRMVARESPAIKAVSIWARLPGHSFDHYWALSPPKPQWPGFFREAPHSVDKLGALEKLTLAGDGRFSPSAVRNWGKHTNFNALRSLQLHSRSASLAFLQALTVAVKSQSFASLQTLALAGYSFSRHEQGHFDSVIAQLLHSLRPLAHLHISGIFRNETLNAILSYGPTLRKLRLIPERGADLELKPYVLTRARIKRLVRACPEPYRSRTPYSAVSGRRRGGVDL